VRADLRLSIARAQLNALGDPKEDEDLARTEKRNHYLEEERLALEEISEAQRSSLPYKDND
jgi:hypothetical protein